MKVLHTAIMLIAPVSLGTAAIAKPADNSTRQSNAQLKRALAAVAASVDPQGPKPPEHFTQKADRDQGDDHANAGVILRVCSLAVPAAHRSAICPTGVSPE